MASFDSLAVDVVLHPSVSLVDRRPTLSASICANATIASIPLSCTLSAQALMTNVPAFAAFESFGSGISDDDVLCFFIVNVLTRETDELSLFASRYIAFINNFPKSYDSPVFLPPDSQASKLLAHTTVGALTSRLQQQMDADHGRLSALLGQFIDMHPEHEEALPSVEAFTFEAYVTALFSVYSRGADIELCVVGSAGGERRRLLIPVLDMFNHNANCAVSHGLNAETLTVDISTVTSLPAGECCLNYGALPNQRLLLFYGFTVDNNAADFAELYVPLAEGMPFVERKAAVMRACFPEFVPNTSVKILVGGEIPAVLMSLLRLLGVSEENEMATAERRAVVGEGVPMQSQDNEGGALGALENALASMSQAIAVDLLSEEKEDEGEREELVDFVRVYVESELQILSECLSRCRERIEELRGKCIDGCD